MAQPLPVPRPLLSILHEHTREAHTLLNKSVTARIPLCLPPKAASPFVYAAGMVVFGHLYTALEDTWDMLLANEENKLSERHQSILETVRLAGMARNLRLQSDLDEIKLMLAPDAISVLERLESNSTHYQAKVSSSIRSRPLSIIAYAYALYLGLFNGGRWISGLLSDAGADFWQEENSDAVASRYLSFWYFDDTPRDSRHGQSLKNRFREALNSTSDSLLDEEMDEIIAAAQVLFELCAQMIATLDEHMQGLQQGEESAHTSSSQSPSSSMLRLLAHFKPVVTAWQALWSTAAIASTTASPPPVK